MLKNSLINRVSISYLTGRLGTLSIRPICSNGSCNLINSPSSESGTLPPCPLPPSMTASSLPLPLLKHQLKFNQNLPLSLSSHEQFNIKEISDPKPSIPIGTPLLPFIRKSYEDGPSKSPHGPLQDPQRNQRVIEEAPNPNQVEKQAARLIVIRRIKMNKHKLRKLRKKMKYVWAKVKLNRGLRLERSFLDNKVAQIRAAERFDARAYVANIIAKAKQKSPPKRFEDPLMPEWYKKKLLEDKRQQDEFLRLWKIFREKKANFQLRTPKFLKDE